MRRFYKSIARYTLAKQEAVSTRSKEHGYATQDKFRFVSKTRKRRCRSIALKMKIIVHEISIEGILEIQDCPAIFIFER